MNRFLFRTFAALTLCASVTFAQGIVPSKPLDAQPAQATTNGTKEDPQSWWRDGCMRIDHDTRAMGGKIDVAFVGDSITARWTGEPWTKHWGGYRAVNMGIGGDQTQHVLWRLQHGELDGYQARLFVVLIGTNNCWGKTTNPANVAAGVKAILDLIHSKQPQAKILLMGILPAGQKPDPSRETRTAINTLISQFAGGNGQYMDIGAKYLSPDGTISQEVMGDYLHLTPKGYDIWAEAISPKVKEIVGAPATTATPLSVVGAENTSTATKAPEGIVFPHVKFVQATIQQVIFFLNKQSKERDPEKQGLHITLADGVHSTTLIDLELSNATALEILRAAADKVGLKLQSTILLVEKVQ